MKTEKATFGAGCFWGVEAAFRQIKGVISTRVGFMGGELDNPTYEQVCQHNTKHAEVVEVTFNPEKVTYQELLNVFWSNHDPTQVNRQGPDIGDQYRSVIFYHSQQQKQDAQTSKEQIAPTKSKPIATHIEPAATFYEAEEYHQQYLEKRGLSSCHL